MEFEEGEGGFVHAVKTVSLVHLEMIGFTAMEPLMGFDHEFDLVHFNRLTWCGYCKKFIKNPFGKQVSLET